MKKTLFLSFMILLFLVTGCTNNHKILSINDVEKSLQSKGLEITDYQERSDIKKYYNVSPDKIYKVEENDQLNQIIKVYIYPSAPEMEKGLKEFRDEQSKDLTYGQKDIAFTVNNIMLIGRTFSENTVLAINSIQ